MLSEYVYLLARIACALEEIRDEIRKTKKEAD